MASNAPFFPSHGNQANIRHTHGDPEMMEAHKATQNHHSSDTALVRLLRTATEQTAEDDGWSYRSRVAHYIFNSSSFSAINYGYKKLGDLIRATELFDIDMRNSGNSMYIRNARGGQTK